MDTIMTPQDIIDLQKSVVRKIVACHLDPGHCPEAARDPERPKEAEVRATDDFDHEIFLPFSDLYDHAMAWKAGTYQHINPTLDEDKQVWIPDNKGQKVEMSKGQMSILADKIIAGELGTP